jgi:DNA-binding NarL/FixJ family response regulator
MVSSRPRVLLADDYPDIVKAVSRLLAEDCEIVGSVADGSTLLETAQRLQPDVIVLDVNLRNVDSVKACREIRRVNPNMKVIMFTVPDDPNAGQAFVEAGASAFVSKLASLDLLSTIRRLCVNRA